MKRFIARMAALAVSWSAAFAVHAQSDFPTHPIRLINISSPGAGGDVVGRLVAEQMALYLHGTIVTENRPGAAGAIAADMVAKAPPDGYTILIGGITSNVLLAAVRPNLPYDPVKDFDPIGQIGTAPILMVATNDYPANNLKEFIAMAKRSPEPVLYGSWGVGSTGHFCGELLKQRAQIQMNHVPYKGVGQIQSDMLGGQLKLAFIDMASGSPMVKSGRVKALGVCTSRSINLPEVGSFEEAGIDFNGKKVTDPMWAMYAPAGTPKVVLDKLSASLKYAVGVPDVRDKLLAFGIKVDFVGTEPLRELISAGVAGWKDVAKRSNITID